MTPDETSAVLTVVATAHDRAIPAGLLDIWQASLDDLPFALCRDAAMELIRTSPYLPKVAEVRERARLIRAERQRTDHRRLQLEQRGQDAPHPTRNGAAMVAHVLGRLKDAGQDVADGKRLGRERASAIAEEAVTEWLRRTEGHAPEPANGELRACPRCFAPITHTCPCDQET